MKLAVFEIYGYF